MRPGWQARTVTGAIASPARTAITGGMAQIINLRRARKARARDAAAGEAATARARHGRTRAEREAEAAAADHLARTLDGARRDPD